MEDTTMIKKVIDFNRLPKQEYQKPAMEVFETDMDQQILAGSMTNLTTNGLDDDDLELFDEDDTTGSIWDAW